MNEEPKQSAVETERAELLRLPLWRNCLEDMLANGVEYGKTYTAEYFEGHLKCGREDMRFGLGVSEIRRYLESKGFYLSGRGLKGNSFIILQAQDNCGVMDSYSHAALDALKRGVILGTNTRLDALSSEDRRRHESMLEKLVMRLMLVRTCKQSLSAREDTPPDRRLISQ